MCWAAADRMALVASRVAPALEREFRAAATSLRDTLREHAWSADAQSFVGHYGGHDLDASLLQMAPLRFLPPDDPQLHATIDAIRDTLSERGWLFRYRVDDGFGRPKVAFIICTFWLVEALAATGRTGEAKTVMEHVHAALSPLGLLSEDYETASLRMWGNFPQAYSHVGLIRAAFAASPRWTDVL
jgi:GH15 family glucan-1,4-alpha-glucosidase